MEQKITSVHGGLNARVSDLDESSPAAFRYPLREPGNAAARLLGKRSRVGLISVFSPPQSNHQRSGKMDRRRGFQRVVGHSATFSKFKDVQGNVVVVSDDDDGPGSFRPTMRMMMTNCIVPALEPYTI